MKRIIKKGERGIYEQMLKDSLVEDGSTLTLIRHLKIFLLRT